MQALLEHSQKNYGPLPSDLRPRRIRSRTSSRASPYPLPNHRSSFSPDEPIYVHADASPELRVSPQQPTSFCALREVSTLQHELRCIHGQRLNGHPCLTDKIEQVTTYVGNDPMERRALIAKAILTGGQFAEVAGRFGDDVVVELEDNTTTRAVADRDIKLNKFITAIR